MSINTAKFNFFVKKYTTFILINKFIKSNLSYNISCDFLNFSLANWTSLFLFVNLFGTRIAAYLEEKILRMSV